jgi:exodeoxyribonuclease VII large subunit
VITGIGHERDETVADLVAHTKLKTPTAVAEFLISGMNAFEEKLRTAVSRLATQIDLFKQNDNYRLERMARRLSQSHTNLMNKHMSELDKLRHKLFHRADLQIEKQESKLDSASARLQKGAAEFVDRLKEILEGYQKSVNFLDPKKVFDRGYTLTLIGDKLLRDVEKLQKGASVLTYDATREIKSTITEIKIKGK